MRVGKGTNSCESSTEDELDWQLVIKYALNSRTAIGVEKRNCAAERNGFMGQGLGVRQVFLECNEVTLFAKRLTKN
jgi:hypothetical protein